MAQHRAISMSCWVVRMSVAAGMNPMDLRRGINLAVETVLKDLKASHLSSLYPLTPDPSTPTR